METVGTPRNHRWFTGHDPFEGTEQIQQLVIASAISGMRIEQASARRVNDEHRARGGVGDGVRHAPQHPPETSDRLLARQSSPGATSGTIGHPHGWAFLERLRSKIPGPEIDVVHPVIVVKQEGRRPLYLQVREVIEIGRECDGLILADGQASRRHASLTPRGDSVIVEDLGSTNGTLLDGTRITSAVVLLPGSIIRIGDTVLQLVDAASAGQPVPAAAGGSRSTIVTGADSFGGAVRGGASGPAGIRETSMDAVARAVEQAPPPLQAIEHDSGTITIVFSDIESSTQRATSMGDAAWMKVLTAHNDIIQRHVHKWEGTVVKNQGDGFMLTFGGARRALRAMIEVQRDLEQFAVDNPDRGVRVRVGVHTGEVIAEDGDIFGKHVMLAARVGGLAEGAEILVSSLVREIAGARGDLAFGEPRAVALKGIEGEHVVYPLVWQDFADDG
jgi:adenylate cyclase